MITTRVRRRSAATIAATLTAGLLAFSASPASAETTIGQATRCDAGAAFVDLTITNTDPTPLGVNVLVDGSPVATDLTVPTGDTAVSFPYLPHSEGDTIQVVTTNDALELASATLAAAPECPNPDISIQTTSVCDGAALDLVITVLNAGTGDALVDVTFGGGEIAQALAVPAGESASVTVPFPPDLNPENQDQAVITVHDAQTDALLAEAPLSAGGRHCEVVPLRPVPPRPADPRAPRIVVAAPAPRVAAAPDYTG